jgi:hypothetical protein
MKVIENEQNVKIKVFNIDISFKYQKFTSNLLKDEFLKKRKILRQ